MKRLKCKLGDLVEVTWLDACGYTNAQLRTAIIQKTTNLGRVVVLARDRIVIQSGRYSDAMYGDFVAIPRQWTDEVRVIEEGGAE